MPVADAEGARWVHWSEASNAGVADPSQVGVLAQPTLVPEMKAPPIVKTSGQAKSRRIAHSLALEVTRMTQILGRKPTWADLSEQWCQAFRLDVLRREGYDLKLTSELTDEQIRRIAEIYLEEAFNRREAILRKWITRP